MKDVLSQYKPIVNSHTGLGISSVIDAKPSPAVEPQPSPELHDSKGTIHAIEAELMSRIKNAQFDIELGALVGRGGFGRVYKGNHRFTL